MYLYLRKQVELQHHIIVSHCTLGAIAKFFFLLSVFGCFGVVAAIICSFAIKRLKTFEKMLSYAEWTRNENEEAKKFISCIKYWDLLVVSVTSADVTFKRLIITIIILSVRLFYVPSRGKVLIVKSYSANFTAANTQTTVLTLCMSFDVLR